MQTETDPISIARLTHDTREACLALQVLPEQAAYLPDVRSSLELAAKYPKSIPLAISHSGHGVVGFALVGVDDATGLWKLFRLLIHAPHQGRGYGKLAVAAILTMLRTEQAATEVLVTYQEQNRAASRLYAQLGFSEYGKDGTKVLARRSGLTTTQTPSR